MVLKVTYTLQSKCKTCFGGPRMVLQAHLKKHIIALGGWLLMYTSGPSPRFGKRPDFFRIFFLIPSLRMTIECGLGVAGGRVLQPRGWAEYTTLVKSQPFYCYRLFHVCNAQNHQAYGNASNTICCQLWNQAMQVTSPEDQILNQFGTNQNMQIQKKYKSDFKKYRTSEV